MHSAVKETTERNADMRLKIRYENEIQTVELDRDAINSIIDFLNIEEVGQSQEEMERRIQTAFDEQYNRPEYNVWHRETRHIDPVPKCKRLDGKRGYIQAEPDDSSFDTMDYLARSYDRYDKIEADDICKWIWKTLEKKPEWAEAFIEIRINGMSIREYAMQKGVSENSITQKLNRAAKKLKEKYRET